MSDIEFMELANRADVILDSVLDKLLDARKSHEEGCISSEDSLSELENE